MKQTEEQPSKEVVSSDVGPHPDHTGSVEHEWHLMNRCSTLRQTDWASGPHASQPLASGHPGEGEGITS